MENFNGEIANKTAELDRMKEDLRQAKEDATQSWLDSRPLLDELEKLQAESATTKSRLFKMNTNIAELQAQLGTTEMCIKSAKDEDQNARMMINEKNQDVHMMQEKMQQLRKKIDQKRRRRSKLKLVLRLKRQTLETLELTSEAIRLETEAFTASATQALYYINNKDGENVMIQLTQEEYARLKEEANREILRAEWRISVSEDEKLAAEKSRDLAFKKMQSFRYSSVKGKTVHNEASMNTEQAYTVAGSLSKHRVNSQNQPQQSKNYSSFHEKKKESICFRIKTFIVRSLAKYFK